MLEALVDNARLRARERERRRPLRAIERAAAETPPVRGLAQALAAARSRIGLVAELKKASPSAGILRSDFDVSALARAYARGGAHALSVLTEVDHFQGALAYLEQVHDVGVPVLQKDFVVSEYQIFEGRSHGADAVLLIAEALTPDRLRELVGLARDLGMDVLCEAHEPRNVRRMAEQAERDPEHVLVGVNNRDLRTFEVSLETSLKALAELPPGLLVVAESGIRTGDDLVRLRDAGARGVLVGEGLIRVPDVEAATRALLAPLGDG